MGAAFSWQFGRNRNHAVDGKAMNPYPTFTQADSNFLPSNGKANELCDKLKKLRLSMTDIITLRAMGHDPRLTNGERIGGIDICV
jgi:hypothetical protein